jgi:hypothetical protein
MTQQEVTKLKSELAVAMKAIELEKAGKEEEGLALMKAMPLPPHIAKMMKESFGAEATKASGWNLSEAYAAYGNTWLD